HDPAADRAGTRARTSEQSEPGGLYSSRPVNAVGPDFSGHGHVREPGDIRLPALRADRKTMNRLQKKCLIASLALHALLCVILLVGPALLSSNTKGRDQATTGVIRSKIVDSI